MHEVLLSPSPDLLRRADLLSISIACALSHYLISASSKPPDLRDWARLWQHHLSPSIPSAFSIPDTCVHVILDIPTLCSHFLAYYFLFFPTVSRTYRYVLGQATKHNSFLLPLYPKAIASKNLLSHVKCEYSKPFYYQ